MAKREFRGVEPEKEVKASSLIRDTRPLGQKITDFLTNPTNSAASIAGCGIIGFQFPAPMLPEICLLVGAGLSWFSLTRKPQLSFKMPQSSGLKLDYNDMKPDGSAYMAPRGISYFGNRLADNSEIWFSDDDLRTHILIFGSTGSGKAQPLNAKVLTPTGWVNMGNIRKGMRVSTPDGGSALVDGIYPQGKMDIYEIEFQDGRKTRATGEHLWEVHNKGWKDRKYKKGESSAGKNTTRILTTLEIENKLSHFQNQKYSVRLPAANFKGSGESLPIHPYIMGAMLGNGNFSGRNFRVSIDDQQIKSTFESFLPDELYMKNYECDADYDYWILQKEPKLGRAVNGDYQIMPMKLSFKPLGLWDKRSHEKFIPESYLEASLADRMLLIQGLMDTDGTAGLNGGTSYSTSSKLMAEQFQKLIWSIGGIATISPKKTSYTYLGEKKSGMISYRVNIRHNDPKSLFLSTRKSDRVKDYQYAGNVRLGFKSITKVGFEEAQCIHIDHPDHLYITDNFITTHNTEALLSISYNAINQGSGFIYVDGKGDNGLWAKIYGMVRERGREDDLLVINYMTGNSDVGEGPQTHKLSNTMNPFSTGSSDGLTQLMVGLMDSGGGGGDMWKGRAISLISGLMMALVSLRDRGELLLDVQAIRDFMNLEKIIDLCKDESLTDKARSSIKGYLDSLPGFNWKKGKNQSDTVMDQHGYLQMQFTKIMGSLSDTYGHIFKAQLGDVDFYDVVVNRRILVVLLPALEKSPDELANLGKIIVASLKSMMATGLGSAIEGSYKSVVEAKPNNSPAPFTTILDEYGYYAVSGSAVMPAQARSLGFSMIFAGQDLPAFEKASPEEAASILGNCNIKIFMKLEEPEKTYKLFESSVGDAYVTQTGGFNNPGTGIIGGGYVDTNNASIEKRSRGDMRDLKGQRPGEAHIIFGPNVVRMKWFYANPPKPLSMRVNQFLRVRPPSKDKMAAMDEAIQGIIDAIGKFMAGESLPESFEVEDISTAASAWAATNDALESSPIEHGIASLYKYAKAMDKRLDEFDDDVMDIDAMMDLADSGNPGSSRSNGMIFAAEESSKTINDVFGEEIMDIAHSMTEDSVGNRAEAEDRIRRIEKAAGASDEDSARISKKVINDANEATNYPVTQMANCNPEEFVNAMDELDKYIGIMGDSDESNGDGE